MSRLSFVYLSLSVSLSLAACASSSGAQGGGVAAELCTLKMPCGDGAQSADDRDACIQRLSGAAGDPCLTAMTALKSCVTETTKCTASGAIDEAASLAAMEQSCATQNDKLGACCEANPSSLFCEHAEGG